MCGSFTPERLTTFERFSGVGMKMFVSRERRPARSSDATPSGRVVGSPPVAMEYSMGVPMPQDERTGLRDGILRECGLHPPVVGVGIPRCGDAAPGVRAGGEPTRRPRGVLRPACGRMGCVGDDSAR